MNPKVRSAAILALALAAFGCRRASPGREKALVIGQLSSATVLDPHLQNDERTYSTLDHFYNKLVTFGPELQIVPELATRWENLSDTVWRFHLRKGVVFHDGSPFGAADVLATIRRAQTVPGSLVNHYVQSIREIRVEDDSTILFVTRDPTPVLLNELVFIDIVPRATGSSAIERPVGTGPYEFVSGKPGAPILGKRFDRYWGPRPFFERVTILPLPDNAERAHAISNGTADLVARFPEEYWRWAGTQDKMRIVRRQGVSEILIGFSLASGSAFSDVRLRRAVGLTLDRAQVAARGLQGLGGPLDQLVPSTVFGFSNRLPRISPDSGAAVHLLSEAGYPKGLDATAIFPDYLQGVAEEVRRQLGGVGIRLQLVPLPFERFNERWSRQDSSLAIFSWGAGTGDISDLLDALLHSRQGGLGQSNHFGYASERLDRLIDLSDHTLEPGARLDLLTSAQKIIREDLPVVPLVLRFDLYAARRGLNWIPRPDRRLRAFDVRPER
ncbi:MAG: ABC transporter substrate-binding protein [Thermoanaerobaculia bacterium]